LTRAYRALWRRVDEAKGFRRAWRLDFGVTETGCLDGDFLIVGTGYKHRLFILRRMRLGIKEDAERMGVF